MDIMLLPADKSGCGLYRMLLPGREVASTSDHKLFFGGGVMGRVEQDDRGRPLVTYLPPLNVDVIVFQRPLDWIVAQCVPLAQKQGVAVVVEIDDDVQNVDSRNFAHGLVSPSTNPVSNWKHLMSACKQADWVTVSTPALRRYAPHGRVSVIPNAVPKSLLNIPDRPLRDPARVCWPGAVATHPTDLQVCGKGVAAALERTGAEFVVVGDKTSVQRNLQLEKEPEATGWLELPLYPETLRAEGDVGIVPLADNVFNRSKSYLKGLEMAAMGIPFVASALPEYRDLHRMGVGQLARSPYEWEESLVRLLTDESHRVESAQRSRTVVAEKLTMSNTVDKWEDAWSAARRHRDDANVRKLTAVR